MTFIKKAEKNVINISKELSDILEILDGLSRIGNRYLQIEEDKKIYFEGLKNMRYAIYKKFVQSIAQCFYMVGVGGEEAKQYSREQAREIFNGKYSVMQYLDKYGMIPGAWKGDDEKQFKKELKEAIEKEKEKE